MSTHKDLLDRPTFHGRWLAGMVVLFILAAALVSEYRSQLKTRQENQSLRQEAQRLQAESEHAKGLLAEFSSSKRAATSQLPASPVPVTTQASRPPGNNLMSSNLILRLMRGEEDPPELTPEEVEFYLEQTGRDAPSLLAAFRATRDDKLLQEALEKYPNDPQVNFAAAVRRDLSPEEKRQRLEAFKQSAPDNAMANYLLALDYFKSGQTDQGVQELSSAASKPQLQDYSMEFMQNAEEAYRAAGYSEAESKLIAGTSLLLPHLGQLRDLGRNMIDLASSYRQTGDEASAQTAVQMVVNLGQRLDGAPRETLISQLVGIALERNALGTMDPASPYGATGQTIKDRLDELTQTRTSMKALTQQFDSITPQMSEQDWSSYMDRQRIFGEKSALQWLVTKYGKAN